ncbi:MAG: multicopper oxidase domain-containing protein, partial [Anaerolineae bacterium]|nr:multicopper oxidase domain-containing protein [Anaerolineae bacterium]
MISRRDFLKLGAGVGAGVLLPHGIGANALRLMAQAPGGPVPVGALLDPRTLTKYIDPLPVPGPILPPGTTSFEIGAYAKTQQLHSQLPAPTPIWGYGTSAGTASFPAATIEVTRNTPIDVHWTNNLTGSHPLQVDPTMHWANPAHQGYPVIGDPFDLITIPLSPHVHGGEQEAASDGHPDAWFTPGFALKGPGWQHETFHYHNEQPPTTLWYHDHALGITRLNVYMGLAGFYIVRDPATETALGLPSGEFEIPLVIQDRLFDINGQLVYPVGGDNPTIHPFWVPEFFGDTMLVNGAVWPVLDVKPGKYRFRILNGSNARF